MTRTVLPLLVLACSAGRDLPEERPPLSADQVAELGCASRNQSTAPSYLWVSVQGSQGVASWSVVAESARLPEEVLDDPIAAVSAETASSLDALHPRYSYSLLADARIHLFRFSDAEIKSELTRKSQGGAVRRFIAGDEHWQRQEALAHALFERGFFPSRGDLTPDLYVTPTPCEDERETLDFLESLPSAELSEKHREALRILKGRYPEK